MVSSYPLSTADVTPKVDGFSLERSWERGGKCICIPLSAICCTLGSSLLPPLALAVNILRPRPPYLSSNEWVTSRRAAQYVAMEASRRIYGLWDIWEDILVNQYEDEALQL